MSGGYTLAEFTAVLGAPPIAPPSAVNGTPFLVPTTIGDGDRHDVLYRFLRSQKARGVTLAVALAGCRALNAEQCAHPLDERELTAYLTRVWSQGDRAEFAAQPPTPTEGSETDTPSDFARGSKGHIVADSQLNIALAVRRLDYAFTYDLFAEKALACLPSGRIVTVDDSVLRSLWFLIDRTFKFRPSPLFFEKMVAELAQHGAFHPVLDYLNGLVWDGVSRIDRWLVTYGGAEDSAADSQESRTYLEAVSSITLMAAVRRVRRPGCKYDEMLVLESPQGFSKSSAIRSLSPCDAWFSDNLPLNVDSKQVIESTLGKWIIEASDLVGGRKADRDHLKAMLSRQRDGPARMAYAHLPVERDRQFIIIGTTNSASYLADMTGARRFWPVKVKRFDTEALTRDRDQLWAEAAHREATGEAIRLPEALWEHAGAHQDARREIDAWEDVLAAYIGTLTSSASGRLTLAASAAWDALHVPIERRDRLGALRLSEILQRFGWARQSVRVNGIVQTGYVKETQTCAGDAAAENNAIAEPPPF